ncbi:MAG: signal peptide peptidase SppA [Streptosporangiaceae bacterium]
MIETASELVGRAKEIAGCGGAPLVLELDLTVDLMEGVPQDPLSVVLSRRRPRLHDVLEGLRHARSDPRVRMLVAKVGSSRMGLARAQELRDAVQAFRESGKSAIAWAETFGEFAPGTVPYYLASAFDRVYLQPSGDVGLTGVSLEQHFLRGALDKAGVTPQIGQRHEYKNAANMFTQHGFTEAHRESYSRIAASMAEQVIAGVAEGRRVGSERVSGLVDRGPLLGREALDAGLVDKLAYRDEVYDDVRKESGDEAHLQFVGRYQHAPRREITRRVTHRHATAVALIYGVGPVRLGRSGRHPLQGQSMGSDTVAAAFRAAVKEERVRAILFRVDSPGGSYVASDTIWREVVRARQAGKPVVVSMGNVAGSGGYFVAMAADAIVAQPGTLTGSIGVLGGKPVVSELLDRAGVGYDAVAEGAHARMFSASRAYSDSEWERVNTWLDRIYDDFTAKVAQGRGLSRDRVHELARGRVWTGADAKDNALIDELGGIEPALAIVRAKAGLPADADVDLQVFPKVTPLDRLRPAESSESPSAAAAALRLEAWGPMAVLADRLGFPAWGPLTMPGVREAQ